MNCADIVLRVNELEYIVLQFMVIPEAINFFEFINIIVHTKDHQKYIITFNYQWYLSFLQDYREALEQLLHGERVISESDATDLGLRAIQADFLASHRIDYDHNMGILNNLWRYSILFDGFADCDWLYELNSRYYLELTPSDYRRQLDMNPEDVQQHLQIYEQRYQVLSRWELPPDLMRQWISILKELYAQAERNDELIRSDIINVDTPCVRDDHVNDVCRYHDASYGTDPKAQQMFLSRLQNFATNHR